MGIFPLGDDKVSINHLFGQNFVMRTLKLDTLDFFENRHFIHKKWLINIYFTFQNHNSLRKEDSSDNWKKELWTCFDDQIRFARNTFKYYEPIASAACFMKLEKNPPILIPQTKFAKIFPSW